MVTILEQRPAERLREAYALWADSKGLASEQWHEIFGDELEMRSVLSPELPDDLAAVRYSRAGAFEYFETLASQREERRRNRE